MDLDVELGLAELGVTAKNANAVEEQIIQEVRLIWARHARKCLLALMLDQWRLRGAAGDRAAVTEASQRHTRPSAWAPGQCKQPPRPIT